MKVTQNMVDRDLAYAIGRSTAELMKLTEQLSSGKRINRISDDPSGTVTVLNLRRRIQSMRTYLDNAKVATNRLSHATDLLGRLSDMLVRVKQLATQAATGTYNTADRQAMAMEVNEILDEMVAVANTSTAGGYLFSGMRTRTAPFEVSRDAFGRVTAVSYQGAYETTKVRTEPGRMVEINFVGKETFGSLFDTMVQLRDAMLNDDADGVSALLPALDGVHESISSVIGGLGGRLHQMEVSRTTLEKVISGYTDWLSSVEDADIGSVTMELTRRRTLLEMTAKSVAMAVKPSVLDYI